MDKDEATRLAIAELKATRKAVLTHSFTKTYNAIRPILQQKKTVSERLEHLDNLYVNANNEERQGVIFAFMTFIAMIQPVTEDLDVKEEPNNDEKS